MPRRPDEQIRASYQAQIAKLQQKVRRIDRRTEIQTRKQRNHRLIVTGTLAETHALKNPRSEFARLLVGLLEQYARPEDRHLFADLFEAVLAAPEAERPLGAAAIANNAESITEAPAPAVPDAAE